MKNTSTSLTDKLISKYLEKDNHKDTGKSTDINILLNRVKSDQKRESRKKIMFSAAATAGVALFGFLIF